MQSLKTIFSNWPRARAPASDLAPIPADGSSDPFSREMVLDNRFWTLFRNAFRLRCAICKQGRIFDGYLGLAHQCPACGVVLEREPGYFLGSIYFNYGATCSLVVVMYLVIHFAWGVSNTFLMPPLFAFTLLFPLWFLRYARSSWMVFDQFFHPRFPPTMEPRD